MFPINDNASHLTWSDHAWHSIYWNPQLLDRNLLIKSKYNYTVSAGSFTPQHNNLAPTVDHIENWNRICPPRTSNRDQKTNYLINGTNKQGLFVSENKSLTNKTSTYSKPKTNLKFAKIACAKDYAIGVVNKLGQSQLYLISLDDLSIELHPFDLDHYLTTDRLSLNNKKQLAVPLRKGLISSPLQQHLYISL